MIFFHVDHFWTCYNIASVLCFDFFGLKACGILVPPPGIEPTPLHWKLKSYPWDHRESPTPGHFSKESQTHSTDIQANQTLNKK